MVRSTPDFLQHVSTLFDDGVLARLYLRARIGRSHLTPRSNAR